MSTGIEQTIRNYILREFLPGEDATQLTDETPLITSGIIDSIRTLKLVSFLEDTFSITFEAHETDADHLNTVTLIAALVQAKS